MLWDESEMSGCEEYIWDTFGIHLEYIWEKHISDVHFGTFAYIFKVHPRPKKPFHSGKSRCTSEVHFEYIWSTFLYIWRLNTSPYI